jgi:ATP-dependent Clp protease, protease subunit
MGRSSSRLTESKPTRPGRNEGIEGIQIQHIASGDSARIVVLAGDVNEQSITLVVAQLLHLASQNNKPIHLVISTYGGSVDEMFTLYDTIKFLPCPVHTIALGKVMSAGVLLLASGAKGKRMIGRSARLMVHPVSGGSGGNIFEVINDTREMKRQQSQMIDALVKETKSSRTDIEKLMKAGHDVYLTPQDAIRLGIVDRIIGDSD